MSPLQAILHQEQTQDLTLGVQSNQLTNAIAQQGGSSASDQAEQMLQGEQAAFARLAGLVQPAAKLEPAEGGIDVVGRLAAAAVTSALEGNLLGDQVSLVRLQGVEGGFQGQAAEFAGEIGKGGLEVLGGLGGDGATAVVEHALGQLSDQPEQGGQHGELLGR